MAECPTCMQPVVTKVNCARCKEAISSAQTDVERDCLSIKAFRRGTCVAAFAPNEVLWAFKRAAGSPEEVTSESELRRRFNSGELDASVLVRTASQEGYAKADVCPEFRDVARPRPKPERPDPLWQFKTDSKARAETLRQSELMRRFVSGGLDAETLVRKKRPESFVKARYCPLFASIARPRSAPPSSSTARTLVSTVVSSILVPASSPVRSSRAAAISPIFPPVFMGFTRSPQLIGILSIVVTGLIGFAGAKLGLLRSPELNMGGAFLPIAIAPFVVYCLAHGVRGNTRILGEAALVGGLLWLCIGVPLVRMLGFAGSYESKVWLGVSVFVLPLIAGLTGNELARFAARRPHSMRWSIPLIYMAFTCAVFVVVFIILKPLDYGR